MEVVQKGEQSTRRKLNAMRYTFPATMSIVTLTLCALSVGPVSGDDYSATKADGVRIFSEVPPVGVHPRVLMSRRICPSGGRK